MEGAVRGPVTLATQQVGLAQKGCLPEQREPRKLDRGAVVSVDARAIAVGSHEPNAALVDGLVSDRQRSGRIIVSEPLHGAGVLLHPPQQGLDIRGLAVMRSRCAPQALRSDRSSPIRRILGDPQELLGKSLAGGGPSPPLVHRHGHKVDLAPQAAFGVFEHSGKLLAVGRP